MKNIARLLFLLIPLTLSSCVSTTSTKKKSKKSSQESGTTTSLTSEDRPTSKSSSSGTNPSTSSSGSSSSSSSSSGTSSTSEIPPEEDSPFTSISLSDRELDVVNGSTSKFSITVSYSYASGVNPDDVAHSVTWKSLDESIATISPYGKVTGVSVGQTVVTCTTNVGSCSASCVIYVVESESSYTIEWQKVTHQDQLSAGDLVIFGCEEKSKAATKDLTGSYLHSTSITISGNKVTSLGSAEQFMLNKNGDYGAWTFENTDGKYLAAHNTKNLDYVNKTGNISWIIDYDTYDACFIESTSTVNGWFMYDERSDRFNIYDSEPQVDMFLITLYKRVKIRNS